MEMLMDRDADLALGFWLLGVIGILLGLLGIFGNLMSIRILSHKQMRSSVNFILIALACSDLILIVTSILLFGLTTVYPYTDWFKDYFYIFRPRISLVAFPLAKIAQTVSIYMAFLISLERYTAVCHPFHVRALCSKERTRFWICLVVALSVAYNLPKFFEISLMHAHDEVYGTFYFITASRLRTNPTYITIYINWCHFIFLNIIPLSGITFFNLMIYHQVRIVNRTRTKLASQETQDIKLTTMLFCVVIVFMICNFPAVVTNMLETFYHIHSDRLTKVTNFCVTFNSSVNFMIYVVCVKKFRMIFIGQFRSWISFYDSYSEQTTNETI